MTTTNPPISKQLISVGVCLLISALITGSAGAAEADNWEVTTRSQVNSLLSGVSIRAISYTPELHQASHQTAIAANTKSPTVSLSSDADKKPGWLITPYSGDSNTSTEPGSIIEPDNIYGLSFTRRW